MMPLDRIIPPFKLRLLRIGMIGIALWSMPEPGLTQQRITDQVAVAITETHLLGITTGQGLVRLRLSSSEQVMASQARGINALVQTSDRLLAFSGTFQRWATLALGLTEEVTHIHVSPRFILVQTGKRVLGFQANRGHWSEEDLGSREIVERLILQDHVGVVITGRRVLGFSAFTGGFFPEDLGSNEELVGSKQNDNIIILQTSIRQLVFRSNLAIWAEIR